MAIHAGLEDRTVSQIMVRNPVSIPAETPLDAVVEDYFYRHHHTAFPMVCNGALLGCIRIEDVGRVKREDRMLKTAADVLSAEGRVSTVSPDMPAMDALKTMQERRTSRLMVAEKDVLKGVLTMRDILNHLSIRQQLETDRTITRKVPLANA